LVLTVLAALAFLVLIPAVYVVAPHGGVVDLDAGDPPVFPSDARPRALVVQMTCAPRHYATESSFRRWVEAPLNEALSGRPAEGPLLVCYPEFVGIGLYMTGDVNSLDKNATLSTAMSRVARRHIPSLLKCVVRFRETGPRALLSARAPEAVGIYLRTFSALAAQYRVTIAAGSMPMPRVTVLDRGARADCRVRSASIWNTACLFGPGGRLLQAQRKVNLTKLEGAQGLDLISGDLEELSVVQTPLGCLGVAICADAFYSDVVEHLVRQGADILIQPSANPGVWSAEQQRDWLTGGWQAAQERPALRCVVNPMMTGALLDVVFEGQSNVAVDRARCDRAATFLDLPETAGFLAVAPTADSPCVLCIALPVPSSSD
jgi:predicted amidohydrolase